MFSRVAEFTRACQILGNPRAMTADEVAFAARMVTDELLELLVTRFSIEDARALLAEHVQKTRAPVFVETTEVARAAEQADALVDAAYYVADAAARAGLALDPVFDLVHAANMAKVVDGKVLRVNGKIVKPPGWAPPDINAEMERQFKS